MLPWAPPSPPEFHAQLVSQLAVKDGLAVVGAGLGLDRILHAVLLDAGRATPDASVLVLNCSREEQRAFAAHAALNPVVSGTPARPEGPSGGPGGRNVQGEASSAASAAICVRMVSAENSAEERRGMYARGGILFVTSRVLVVDFLNGTVRAADVAGVVVHHAEACRAESHESLILKLFRSGNPGGWVRALSGRPEAFAGGAKANAALSALTVSTLYLWPRFHARVRAALEQRLIEVTEVIQGMPAAMEAVQNVLLTMMSHCLAELSGAKSTRTAKQGPPEKQTLAQVDAKLSDLAGELARAANGVHKSGVRLANDVNALRGLARLVTQLDCVAFYRHLEALRRSKSMAYWLFSSLAEELFSLARNRTLRGQAGWTGEEEEKGQSDHGEEGEGDEEEEEEQGEAAGTARRSDAGAGGKKRKRRPGSLEENPKWDLLLQILSEERVRDCDDKLALVMASSVHVLAQLRGVLAEGGRAYMRRCQREAHAAAQHAARGPAPEPRRGPEPPAKRGRSAASAKGARVLPSGRPLSGFPGSGRPLMRPYVHVAYPGGGEGPSLRPTHVGRSNWDAVHLPFHGAPSWHRSAVAPLAAELANAEDDAQGAAGRFVRETSLPSNRVAVRGDPVGSAEGRGAEADGGIPVYVEPYTGGRWQGHLELLRGLRPSVVVLYEPDVDFVRALEMWRAEGGGDDNRGHGPGRRPVRLFFLAFENSFELLSYSKQLLRERDAFEFLITHKGQMVTTLGGDRPHERAALSGPLQAGHSSGASSEDEKGKGIIVDIREFSSDVPSLLHWHGLRITPATIAIGDYVLTPNVCVERKSLPDLFQSLRSGRLYDQAVNLCRAYAVPILLIDFHSWREFGSSAYAGPSAAGDIHMKNVISKLALLLLHFPSLRAVWSRNAQAAASLFKALKQGQDDPSPPDLADLERLYSKGGLLAAGDTSKGGADGLGAHRAVRDLARSLPGVRAAVDRREPALQSMSLRDLARAPVDRLEAVLGAKKAAKDLTSFLDHKL